MDYKSINDYEILYLVKEKDDGAYDLLFQKYLPIIKSIASRYSVFAKNRGADFEDLLQEGYLGLNNAISSYRDDCNSLFYSYASLCIERQISVFCRGISSKKHEVLSMAAREVDYSIDMVIASDQFSPEKELSDLLLYDFFSQYSYSLQLENSCILELRFNGFSYKEISQLLDLSVTTIDGRLCKMRKTMLQKQQNYF